MSGIVGYAGGVKIGSNLGNTACVLVVKKWEHNDECELVDITPMCRLSTGNRKTYTPTLTSWTVNVDGQLDPASGHWTGSAPVIRAGATAYVELYLGPTLSTSVYKGTGIVKSIKPSVSVEGVVEFSTSIEGSGNLTHPTTLT